MVRAEGCRLFDAHGRPYLNGFAGLCVVNVGHGRAEIAEAMPKQTRELAYVSADSYTNLAAVQLADVLARLTPG
jgi:adenosylmethionine-8-amino-7-oxononanoate aminotransferase